MPNVGSPHILIVEDDPSLCMTYRSLFDALGWTVSAALTGEDAIEHLGRPDARDFDVVLTDYWLPGKDGLDVLAEARRLGLPARVIVMTAACDKPTHDRIAAAAPDRFQLKPYVYQHLATYLEAIRVESAARRAAGHAEAKPC